MFHNNIHFFKWLKMITPFSLLLNVSNGYSQVSNANPVVIDGKARFTIIAPELIRIEYSNTGNFIDNRSLFAVNRDAKSPEFTFRKENSNIFIETAKFKLSYKPDGLPFSSGNLEVVIRKGKEDFKWTPAIQNKENLGGTIRTLDQVRGKVPLDAGVLSRDGWYLLDDSKNPVLTDDWVKARPKESGTDWYLFVYGFDFKAALKALTKIGGEIPLPRKYTLGSWYSRYWPYSSDEYRQIVREYKENDFPLDVMVMDMDWHKDGWTGWSWNRKLLPDAEQLLKWFHEQNLRVTLNVHPSTGIGPHEDMYNDFMKDMGVDLSQVSKDKPPTLPYDASNKVYLDKLFKHTHDPLEKAGVDFWWLDWQQFKYTIGIPELENLPWLNRYYFLHSGKDNNRGISFSRWGGWGDHKYPIHFSGDAVSIWPMLEFEVPFTAAAGNVGCFFWSHDIGGHFGGLNPETNARWVQFGAMTAALRLHSTRDKNMDKRPWLYEEKYIKSNRIAFHLRSTIFPYIYSSAWQSCKETIPITRPMYFEYPEQEIAYHNPQQYFFGDAFLVAPIVTPGTGPGKVSSQKIWFPDGLWYNWFTNEKYTGAGENLTNVWSDIYEFPLYVKGGVPIPMQKYTDRMAGDPLKELHIRIYPGEDNKSRGFTLYEDDRISRDYLKNNYALTQIIYKRSGDNIEISIDPAKGKYSGQVQSRSYVIELPCTQKTDSALVNNQKIQVEYDNEKLINKINIPEQPIEKAVIISLNVKEVDYSIPQMNTDKNIFTGMGYKSPLKLPAEEKILSYSKENTNFDERQNFISFICGISIYVEEKNKIYILKDQNSIAEPGVYVILTDNTGNSSNLFLEKELDLRNGENKLIEIKDQLQESFGTESSRTLSVKFKINGIEFSLSKMIEQIDSYICNWKILGPFDFDKNKNISDFNYKPEKEKKIDLTAFYKGKANKVIKWIKPECTNDHIIDLEKYIGTDNSIAYAYTTIQSEKDQEVNFDLNTDDGVEVWLNNQKIHFNNAFRAIVHDPDKVKGQLLKGDNKLLVKISQGEGGWGFRVKIKAQFPITNKMR